MPPWFNTFGKFWKTLILVTAVLAAVGAGAGGYGAWVGYKNRQSGLRLTQWAKEPLRGWILHSQNCHSPVPQHEPLPAPQCGNGPADHIPPPPPPPGWE